MYDLIAFTVIPLGALLASAGYALVATYWLWDWRPLLFIVVLLVMAIHQGNEALIFFDGGAERALSGFGEYPETTANLLASIAAVLLLRFVAQERNLSDQFRDLTGRLEERVQERTAELESFAYSVAHDLRTPLRAIDGYTRILKEDHANQLDDEGRRLLSVVRENTQKMGTLINDLLALSRLGRCDMDRQPLDMNRLVEEAYENLCRTTPRANGVSLDVHTLPDAVGDPSMMHQVVTNLLSNAVKFTRLEEAPHIEVRGAETDDGVVFSVRDNGMGFDMNYADKLFGVFERLHDEDAFEGTGVGLAIVDRILRRHDGQVWAESVEGEGTTVHFSLPHDANG